MSADFRGKTVLVIGASGGLGQGFVRAFAAAGAKLLLAARRAESLEVLAGEVRAAAVYALDVTDAAQIGALAAQIGSEHPELEIVVNATGCDVRKVFLEHTTDEIARTLAVNLGGAIQITRAFLPLMQRRHDGYIVHMGGFADGRLAFPYYTADFASRAGLRGFVDAINREVSASGVTIGYFSPSPADTDAERPLHELWRRMGQRIVSVEEVAAALLDAAAHRRRVAVMGGWTTRLFGHVNAVFPGIAEALLINSYRARMAEFFEDIPPAPAETRSRPALAFRLGMVLVIASFALYGVGLLLIPFLSIGVAEKAGAVMIALAAGEISFWAGAALTGKELITRYRSMLNPCNWWPHDRADEGAGG